MGFLWRRVRTIGRAGQRGQPASSSPSNASGSGNAGDGVLQVVLARSRNSSSPSPSTCSRYRSRSHAGAYPYFAVLLSRCVQLLEDFLQVVKLLSRLAEFSFSRQPLVIGKILGGFAGQSAEVGS